MKESAQGDCELLLGHAEQCRRTICPAARRRLSRRTGIRRGDHAHRVNDRTSIGKREVSGAALAELGIGTCVATNAFAASRPR
jgi:hypothetical protein